MQSISAIKMVNPGDTSAPPPRLVRAAHEFEAHFLLRISVIEAEH